MNMISWYWRGFSLLGEQILSSEENFLQLLIKLRFLLKQNRWGANTQVQNQHLPQKCVRHRLVPPRQLLRLRTNVFVTSDFTSMWIHRTISAAQNFTCQDVVFNKSFQSFYKTWIPAVTNTVRWRQRASDFQNKAHRPTFNFYWVLGRVEEDDVRRPSSSCGQLWIRG